MDNNNLLKYAQTKNEIEKVSAYIEYGSNKKAADALGVSKSTVGDVLSRVKKRAALQGYSPEHDMIHEAPDSHIVKGTSTLYKNGNPVLQWVKTDKKMEDQFEVMKDMTKGLIDDIPKYKGMISTQQLKTYDEDLLCVYPLGDPHIGMLSWGEETGQDWDLKIAEEKYQKVFDRLLSSSPDSDYAIILNLGDFFHADNVEGVTSRSGHNLDLDGRFQRMIRVGVRIMRYMIESALDKHQHVHVMNEIGNHDDTGAMFLSIALDEMYSDCDRVTVDTDPTPYHYFRFGKVLIGSHHGHTTKIQNLPLVMAADQPVDWGETTHRYWYTGHIHHDTTKEFSGCKVESFRTLAAKDAYATWHGYRAGQDSKAIVIHSEHGEIERHTVNIAMV